MYFYVDLIEKDGRPFYLIDDEKMQRYEIDLEQFLKMVNRHFKAEHLIIGGITPIIAAIMSKIKYIKWRRDKNLTLSLGEDFARNLPRIKEVLGDELFNDFMEQSRIVKGEEEND